MSDLMREESDDASVVLNYLQPQCFSVLLPIFLHLTMKGVEYSDLFQTLKEHFTSD